MPADKKKYLSDSLTHYCELLQCELFLLETNGKVYLARDNSRVNQPFFNRTPDQYIDRIIHVDSQWEQGFAPYQYCVPVIVNGIPVYYLVISSHDPSRLGRDSALVSVGLADLIAQMEESAIISNSSVQRDPEHFLIESVLDRRPKGQYLPVLDNLKIDDTYMRAVICIEFKMRPTSYYNQTGEIDYNQLASRLGDEVLHVIRNHRYIIRQDICSFYGNNTIIIFKSFLPTKNLTKQSKTLEFVCQALSHDINGIGPFEIHMAHGGIISDFESLTESYRQAKEFISIGKTVDPNGTYYSSERLMFELLCEQLHPQLLMNSILPLIESLQRESNSSENLLECAEALVDSCMNYSLAAKKLDLHRNTVRGRIERFINITGLDPSSDYSASVTVKLAAVYQRLNSVSNQFISKG